MREIKFRGFSNSLESWIFGSLDLSKQSGFDAVIRTHDLEDCYSSKPIDIKTIGQFTGLKDVNGVDVYEGDILEKNGQFIGVVRFSDGYFYVTSWLDYKFKDVAESKIIGNIHQNPELLGWGE